MRAVAYYNFGRWVADCPNPQCTNALQLQPGQSEWTCRFTNGAGQMDGCGTATPIAWPDNPQKIEADLGGKPESYQHWRPEGGA